MAKFQKAKPQQAKLKAAFYGKQGSGKTFTSLLWAEGLAKIEGKRIAYIDTESGTDFYAQTVKERKVHPEAFDFDRIITRSLMEALSAVKGIDPSEYSVLVIDSITHLWEAAQAAYTGRRNSNGSIPVHAWASIKRPYKSLMTEFLNGNFHAILCGREGVLFDKDDDGDMEAVGTKIKAEGETGYEPHILARMIPERQQDGSHRIAAFFEKDRSGVLMGRTIYDPSFATIEPLLHYLGASTQGRIETSDETAEKDAVAIAEATERDEAERKAMFRTIKDALEAASNINELKAAWDLTKGKKGKLGDDLFAELETFKEGRKHRLMGDVA